MHMFPGSLSYTTVPLNGKPFCTINYTIYTLNTDTLTEWYAMHAINTVQVTIVILCMTLNIILYMYVQCK